MRNQQEKYLFEEDDAGEVLTANNKQETIEAINGEVFKLILAESMEAARQRKIKAGK